MAVEPEPMVDRPDLVAVGPIVEELEVRAETEIPQRQIEGEPTGIAIMRHMLNRGSFFHVGQDLGPDIDAGRQLPAVDVLALGECFVDKDELHRSDRRPNQATNASDDHLVGQ